MSVRGVLFDLDGTLVDSLIDIQRALAIVMHAHDRRAPDLAEVRGMVGDGARRLVDRALTATGGLPDKAVADAIAAEFLAGYVQRCVVDTRPYDGLVDALQAMSDRGLRLGVCTNKPRVATLAILGGTGLLDRFGAIVAGDDVARKKPDPAHVLAACDALGLPPSEVAMVGDSVHDVHSARGAGALAVGVGWGYGAIDGADVAVSHPRELLGAIGWS